jgi:hypothetical protein
MDPTEVSSSVSAVLEDAEKIATEFVPPDSSLGKVVGVLILHVEEALGHKLEGLTDEVLGIVPTATATQDAEVADDKKEIAKLKQELAEAEAKA